MRKIEDNVLRVALQPRVSTDEQVLRGYSLDAQEEALVKYANDHNMKIVGIYRDEGNSARKPVLKRPTMLRLLEDVKAGKIDVILFTKLDRWFRNVSEYHAIQRILDKHNVSWQAILEDYQTATADGRLKVNIMLSVAENESDRTSERIKFVFDSKLAKKEVYFNLPFGYKAEMIDGVRRAVKDPETQHIVEYFFNRALAISIRQASEEINIKYDMSRTYRFWHAIAKKEIYTGTYKGIEDFAPAYITKEEFAELNNKHKAIKKTQQNRVYVFTGLIKCPNCGRRLTGKTCISTNGKEYLYYRCSAGISGACNFKQVSEISIEKYLLHNLRQVMEKHVMEVDAARNAEKKAKPKKSEIEKLQERLRRLNVVYYTGNMTDEEYTEQSMSINEQIAKAKAEEVKAEIPINTDAIKAFLSIDFESIYCTLNKEERRRLWRSAIDEIVMDEKKPIGIILK